MIKEDIIRIKSEFESVFKERSDEINCSMLALLSGEHALFLGPPGTAKSMLSKAICETVDGRFFYYLLTRFTTPEELFGPLSLKALQQDDFRRNIDGYLPTAHIAFLDEIFKSNSSILNSVLTILNERRFHNGRVVMDVPLLSVFAASNELPEENESLEALYDRFLFRCSLEYVQDDENFKELIFSHKDTFKPCARLTLSDIAKVMEATREIKIDEDVEKIILGTRRELGTRNIFLSDRRWKKIVKVLKVASATIGRASVDRTMMLLIQHMAWDKPEQKEHIRNILIDMVISGGESLDKLKKDVEDLQALVQKTIDYKFPLPIRCYNCNDVFENSREMAAHWKKCPDHLYYDPYRTSLSLRYFNYVNMVRVLKDEYRWNFVDNTPAVTRSYMIDLTDLKERYQQAWNRVEEDSEGLRKLLADNIWVSNNDRIEILNRLENKTRLLEGIHQTIKGIDTMLEQNEYASVFEQDVMPATEAQ